MQGNILFLLLGIWEYQQIFLGTREQSTCFSKSGEKPGIPLGEHSEYIFGNKGVLDIFLGTWEQKHPWRP